MKKIDYWTPGTKIFVSITSTRSREVVSVTSTQCQIVEGWQEAFDHILRFLQNHRFDADTVTIYQKPRLCEKCMKHATQSLVFDKAEHIEECLCVLNETPCEVHVN